MSSEENVGESFETAFSRPGWLMETERRTERANKMVDDVMTATTEMDNNHKAKKPLFKVGEIVDTM